MTQQVTQQVTQQRRLWALKQDVSAIGFGTWALGGEAFAGQKGPTAPVDEPGAVRAVHAALERGVTFFDTADSYGAGNAERILGLALKEKPVPGVVISTKVGSHLREGEAHKDYSPEAIQTAVEASLRRLQRDRVELLLLHNPPDETDWTRTDALRTALDALVKAGKVGAWGISAASVRGAEGALAAGFGAAVEVVYNVLDRRPEAKVLPLALAQHVAVIARVPLASGFLTGLYPPGVKFNPSDVRSTLPAAEVEWRLRMVEKLTFLAALPGGLPAAALRFAMSNPAVTTVVPGMNTAAQVEANVSAHTAEPLPAALLARIGLELEVAFPHLPPGK